MRFWGVRGAIFGHFKDGSLRKNNPRITKPQRNPNKSQKHHTNKRATDGRPYVGVNTTPTNLPTTAPLDKPEHLCYNILTSVCFEAFRKGEIIMDTKHSFIIYHDYEKYFTQLNLTERGRLITAIFNFNINGVEPEELSPAAYMAFSFMRDQFIRDNEKYQKRLERCRKNGAKGGRPKDLDTLSDNAE